MGVVFLEIGAPAVVLPIAVSCRLWSVEPADLVGRIDVRGGRFVQWVRLARLRGFRGCLARKVVLLRSGFSHFVNSTSTAYVSQLKSLPLRCPARGTLGRVSDVLHCRIGHSRRAVVAVLLVHAFALVALALANLSSLVFVVAALAVMVHGWRNIGLTGTRRAARAFVELEWLGADIFRASRRDGSRLEGRWVGHAFVHPWLISLQITAAPGRWSRGRVVSVPGDGCDAEVHRQLRVVLRRLAARSGR